MTFVIRSKEGTTQTGQKYELSEQLSFFDATDLHGLVVEHFAKNTEQDISLRHISLLSNDKIKKFVFKAMEACLIVEDVPFKRDIFTTSNEMQADYYELVKKTLDFCTLPLEASLGQAFQYLSKDQNSQK